MTFALKGRLWIACITFPFIWNVSGAVGANHEPPPSLYRKVLNLFKSFITNSNVNGTSPFPEKANQALDRGDGFIIYRSQQGRLRILFDARVALTGSVHETLLNTPDALATVRRNKEVIV